MLAASAVKRGKAWCVVWQGFVVFHVCVCVWNCRNFPHAFFAHTLVSVNHHCCGLSLQYSLAFCPLTRCPPALLLATSWWLIVSSSACCWFPKTLLFIFVHDVYMAFWQHSRGCHCCGETPASLDLTGRDISCFVSSLFLFSFHPSSIHLFSHGV